MRIPKTILQVWFGGTPLTPPMLSAIDTWRTLNPSYDHILMFDDNGRKFLADNFTEDVLLAFDTMDRGAAKSDLFRYCYLFVNGGVYSDMDNICLKPLDEWLPKDKPFISSLNLPCLTPGEQYGKHFDPESSFLASVENHKFLKMAINLCKYNVLNKAVHGPHPKMKSPYRRGLMGLTGPKLLAQAILMSSNRSIDDSLHFGENSGLSLPIKVKVTGTKFHDKFWQANLVDENEEPVIQMKYDGYNPKDYWAF